MKTILGAAVVAVVACANSGDPTPSQIMQALGKQGIRVNAAEAEGIRPNVRLALEAARAHGLGNSKVDFAAVEIGSMLGLDVGPGSATVRNIVAAIATLHRGAPVFRPVPPPMPPPPPPPSWETYYHDTLNLWHRPDFMSLLQAQAFHPVKISWEDIGRDEGSVWGDRISDVGIWVRRQEGDPASAQLALSVRRDSNYRDKVLMVPAEKIKVHTKGMFGRTVERTLPERLRELGLGSQHRDRNVIVSNQFAIVPVPAHGMNAGDRRGEAPRAAFNFSIFPYGSTNFVITDVIEGSSDAVVGPGNHQMLYANIHGQKAPFTASRAEDRQDLLRLERELKAQGMDVDVQRYYLIQIPLKREARGIQSSNMGAPPSTRTWSGAVMYEQMAPGVSLGAASGDAAKQSKDQSAGAAVSAESTGLGKVAIGHGKAEGGYFTGSGFSGQRAEEPIRVTVVYFVTPVGRITAKDMRTFTQAFSQWDSQAIWGGSFVTKESL